MAKKPQQVGPSFGGKNFFPTHAPKPILAICRKWNFKTRKYEKEVKAIAYRSFTSSPGVALNQLREFFIPRPRVAHIFVEGVKTTLPVCIHRGTHVNVRHNRDYIAPKKVRVANGEWNGGAA